MRSNACSLCDTEYKIIKLLFDAFHIRSGTGIDAYLIAGANEQRHVYSATCFERGWLIAGLGRIALDTRFGLGNNKLYEVGRIDGKSRAFI